MTVTVGAMDAADTDAVLTIHQTGLDSGDASFEDNAPTWDASSTPPSRAAASAVPSSMPTRPLTHNCPARGQTLTF
jgi:hypothetical protein